MTKITWIIVADGSRARIFTTTSPRMAINEIDALVHTEGRLHDQQLTQDLPGRAFDRVGQGRHAMATKTSPKKQEHTYFAIQLNEYLNAARKQNKFDRLIVIAAPAFLGLLRSRLHEQTADLVTAFIDKDLTKADARQIQDVALTRS